MEIQAYELAISLPFKIDPFGTVAATADQNKIWMDRVRSVIGTAMGERVFRSEFGCAVAGRTYDPEESVVAAIEDDIRAAFLSNLPLLTLVSIEVFLDEYTRVITAEVAYSTPTTSEVLVQVGIATLNGENPISEEIIWQTQ